MRPHLAQRKIVWPSFHNVIAGVIFRGANEQMRGIAAGRIIASVAHEITSRQNSVCKGEGDSWRPDRNLFSKLESAITPLFKSLPIPSFIWAFYLHEIPKSFWDARREVRCV